MGISLHCYFIIKWMIKQIEVTVEVFRMLPLFSLLFGTTMFLAILHQNLIFLKDCLLLPLYSATSD